MSFSTAMIGGIGGAIIGFFGGGTFDTALQGLQIGTFAGALIDQNKSPSIIGPRLDDLTVQTSTYGAKIPRLYGTTAICGNIFWLENNRLKEVAKKNKSGGKGGGSSASSYTYTYFATFALGLCQGPVAGIRRIWIGKTLWYDAGAITEGAVKVSTQKNQYFTFYTGSDTQQPDSRMQATLGVANTPSYRGLSYIVFKDLPLKNYGNTIASLQIKVEICSAIADNAVVTSTKNWTFVPHPTGYFFDQQQDYIQNPYDIRGKANILVRSSYGSYDVRRIEPSSGSYSWDSFGSTCYVIKTSSFQHLSYVFIEWISGSDYKVHYRLNNDIAHLNFDAIGNLSASESGGSLWFESGSGDMFQLDPYDGGVRKNVFNQGQPSVSTGAMLCVRNGHPCRVRISGTQPDYYLSFTEYDSKGNQLLSYYKPFTTTINAATRTAIISSIQTSMMPTIVGDYMYATYISSENTDSYDTTLICLVFNIQEGTLVKQLRLGYNMGADAFTSSSTVSAMPMISYHDGIIHAQWTTNVVLRPKTFYMTFAPWSITSTGVALLSDVVSKECLQSNFLQTGDIDVTQLSQNVRGYVLSSVAAIRSGLAPLQGAFQFDVIQAGYKIKFKPRGGTSVTTIPAKDLGAVNIS